MNVYLHHQSGTSDKVYSLHLRATDAKRWAVIAWYGRRNGSLQTRNAFALYATVAEARADYDARLQTKLTQRDRYDIVTEPVVWPHGPHWLIGHSIVPDHDVSNVIMGIPLPSKSPFPPPPVTRIRRARVQQPTPTSMPPYVATPPPSPPPPPYVAPSQPSMHRQQPSPPQVHQAVIPAWILACFSDIPAPSRLQAADILATLFPSEHDSIAAAAVHPRPHGAGVDWMRAAFTRLPIDQRKPLYWQMCKVLHADYSHDNDLYRRWIATYNRFATP